jgi:NTE family protein
MKVKTYAVSGALLLLTQWICLDTKASEQINKSTPTADTGDNTVVVSDSFDKEVDETQKQIENSTPEDATQSLLPPSGRIMSTKQKIEAGHDATVIVNQNPGSRKKIPAKNSDGVPTIALALGGGGARGAAHIGVLKVLEAEHIHIDQIVGNSMGAIVGGLYAAGIPLDDITTHLEDRSLRRAYMPGGVTKKIALLPLAYLIHPFGPKHYAGFWSGEKLTKYLDSILPRPNMNIADTQIPFSAVAANLIDGKAYRITEGRLATAIKASAAISPLLQPVPMGDKLFIDGGVRANLPASAAKDTGAGLVIAVLVDEPMQPIPAKRFMKLKNIAARMSDIVLAIADERQLQFADMIINPDVSSIPILSNDPKDVKKAIHAGELAARKALPELRQRLHMPTKG